MVGGLLVALAAVGLLLAHQAATERHETQFLVARRAIEAGRRIRRADLAFAPMDLFSGSAAQSFRTPNGVVGATARVDIPAGELLQRSTVGARQHTSGPPRRLTIDLPPAQALDGSIEAGDRVDIVGSGDSADSTALIARRVRVVTVRHPSAGLGSTDTVRLTLIVADEQVAQAVIDGALHGKLALLMGAGDGG